MAAQDALGDEVLARTVRFDDRMDQVLRHVAVVGEQLLGVLGQTVAAVAERRVVVMVADARVEADAVDDLARVQPMRLGIGVQLVEVGEPRR